MGQLAFLGLLGRLAGRGELGLEVGQALDALLESCLIGGLQLGSLGVVLGFQLAFGCPLPLLAGGLLVAQLIDERLDLVGTP